MKLLSGPVLVTLLIGLVALPLSAAADQGVQVLAPVLDAQLNSAVDAPTFSPDGSSIAYAHADGIAVIRLDGTVRQTIPVGPVTAITWSSDGQSIAYASTDHQVSTWSIGAGISTPLFTGDDPAWRPAKL